MKNEQTDFWKGEFGKEYSDRNTLGLEFLEKTTKDKFGFTRTELNEIFLGKLDRSIRILEVGCNTGMPLLCLQKMGFKNLYGIELQEYAVEEAKKHTKGINIIQGDGFDLPFKESFFDLVFTSGVLIHISPDNLAQIISEISRASKKYVWGFEYFSEEPTEVKYHGNRSVMWRNNFKKQYLNKGFSEIKSKKFQYLSDDSLVDEMFLVSKG